MKTELELTRARVPQSRIFLTDDERQRLLELGDGSYLVRDRDFKYSKRFDKVFTDAGVSVEPTAPRAPNQNAFVERWIGSIRGECLNRFIVFGLGHLDHITSYYLDYYHQARPHQRKENKPLLGVWPEVDDGQFRRDGVTPYIEHPAAVASRAPKSPASQAAAWLHDVLEDTELSRDDLIAQGIPEDVVAAVEALTKQDDHSYEENLERVEENALARGVKIADMLSNLADNPTKNQIRKYARGLLRLLEE